ncbi:phage holin family protein [Erysipelothrix rhusiopathiae]|nr:phage holin family protein [Erysipelothrix rhusiopathiae]
MLIQEIEKMTIPVVIMSCLITGYILNNYVTVKVKNIPLTMAILGIILNTLINGFISIELTIIYGAMNGLISTGMYETFKNIIKNDKDD